MGCNCGKPKCDGHCGVSPAVLQINNPSECVLFHRVEVPASMGDSKTNPPKSGVYKNVLLFYEADQTSWLYSSDGIPQKLVNGLTDYEDAIHLPQINGVTLLGDKNSADLELADAPMVITIASGNAAWSGADTAEDIYNFFLNQGKVNVVFEGSDNYGYEIVSAAYIPGEQKMMCMTTVASVDTGSSPVEFTNNALYGLMTFYTVDKAVDVGELDLQPKLSITDFTGLNMADGYVLEGVPATGSSIGMVKPGDGLSVSSDGTLTVIDHVFDTVAEMKQATNLVNGSYAKTLGFSSIGDGGGATYKITNTGTADNINSFEIGDLIATAVNGGVKHISLEQLESLSDGVYTLGEVDVDSPFTLTSQNNRNITIVGSKFNISTSVMMPAPVSGYWILPSFVGCIFENATSDNSRVLITSGGTNTVGTAFTSCKFLNVDCIANNEYVQDLNFTDCYIQSHTCFIDEHDKVVQARFIRCNVEGQSNKIILAKQGLLYFSGTYEGNATKSYHFVDIESHATITLDGCWFEHVKFLNLVGSTTTSGSQDSIINVNGCLISGYTDSTPVVNITNGGHVNLYVNGSKFEAYNQNSRFTNLTYDQFMNVVGDFIGAYAYAKPLGSEVGAYRLATLHDIANAENKYFISQKITLNAQAIADGGVNVTLPVGNYLMIVGAANYSVFSGLNTTTVALIGGSIENSTYTNMIELHTGSSMSAYTFTLTKANASDTTFNLNIQRTSAATAWLSLIKI